MKKIVKLLLASAMAVSTAMALSFGSASQDATKYINAGGKQYQFVLGTASKKGSYHKAGKRLTSGLPQSIAAPTDGSWQNMQLLAAGHINSAFVQADVYNLFLSKNSEHKEKLLASNTSRMEFVQLVMRTGMDEDDLQSSKAKIYAGLASSGGAGSWRNMALLETNYAKAAVLTGNYPATSSIALNKLKNGEVDALVITSYVKPGNSFVDKIVKDKKVYFADVNDRNLNNTITIGGKKAPIYSFVDMPVKKGFFTSKKVETISTEVLLVVNTDLMSTEQLSTILDQLDLKKSGLFY